MKTAELIKQAEEFLAKDGNPFTAFEFSKFIRDYLQELLDRLKRYYEVLNRIKIRSRHGFEAVPFDVQELVRKALEEE